MTLIAMAALLGALVLDPPTLPPGFDWNPDENSVHQRGAPRCIYRPGDAEPGPPNIEGGKPYPAPAHCEI